MSKPCMRCGGVDRYKSGQCKKCQIESSKRWKCNNPEKHREGVLEHQKRHPRRVGERNRRWERKNPEIRAAINHRRRTKKTEAGGSYTADEFKALCKQYDNRCLACGKKKKLEFDHVIPVSKGGTSDISNGQPLCKSCNRRKKDKTIDYRTKPGILRWIQEKLL